MYAKTFSSNASAGNMHPHLLLLLFLLQVSAGSPILLKYGSHDNANLLLSYGFVLPDNPADAFAWPLDMELLLVSRMNTWTASWCCYCSCMGLQCRVGLTLWISQLLCLHLMQAW
jgi:hypothetical protein